MKKMLYVLSVLIIASMVLTACGGTPVPTTEAPATDAPPPPPTFRRPRYPRPQTKFRSAGSWVWAPAPTLNSKPFRMRS
jgi:hypothetical protein